MPPKLMSHSSTLRAKRFGQREIKGRARAWCALDPDATAVAFHDTSADRQPDASSRNLSSVQTFEYAEDLIEVLAPDADAIVAHRDNPFALSRFGVDGNLWRVRATVLDCVADQVLKELDELYLSRPHPRQLAINKRAWLSSITPCRFIVAELTTSASGTGTTCAVSPFATCE